MRYDDVLELPLRVFSLYNSNINRLRAEQEMRQLRILAASNGGEMMREVYSSLETEMGKVTHEEQSAYVPMEEGAIEKLMGLSGNV